MKATRINVENPETRESLMTAAVSAVLQKKTIVIPTDTVYGIAADAFSPEAVTALLAAKGRSRTMPPPVLIFDQLVMPSLAENVSSDVNALAEKFWPGALTLILYSQPSLQWDLGETKGTVALRVPDDEITRDLLKATGPLAVSSANKTGRTAATSADEAMAQLGEDVEVIVDGGIRPVGRGEDVAPELVKPSTIVDCTSDRFVVVREGAISVEELRQVVPSIVTKAELEAEEKQSRVATVEGSALDSSAAVVDNSEGPRASVAEPGTVNETLMANSAGWMKVDQRRVPEAQRPAAPRKSEVTTAPYSVADAYSLVHGGVKDETVSFQETVTTSEVSAAEETATPAHLASEPVVSTAAEYSELSSAPAKPRHAAEPIEPVSVAEEQTAETVEKLPPHTAYSPIVDKPWSQD